jgi:hypothetical protein
LKRGFLFARFGDVRALSDAEQESGHLPCLLGCHKGLSSAEHFQLVFGGKQ